MSLEIPGSFSLSLNTLLVMVIAGLLIIGSVKLIGYMLRKFKKPKKDIDHKEIEIDSSRLRSSFKKLDKIPERLASRGPVVVTLNIFGPIFDNGGSGLGKLFQGSFISGESIERTLETLALLPDNQRPKVLMIRLKTPGGAVSSSRAAARGVKACRNAGIYVITHVVDVATSGGVMVMVESDEIMSDADAFHANIGVLGPEIPHYENVYANGSLLSGITFAGKMSFDLVHEGKGKTLGNPHAQGPEIVAARGYLQEIIARKYSDFVDLVVARRHIPREKLIEIGAAVLDARAALEIGLIDSIGTLGDARQKVAERLGVKTWNDCCVVTFGGPPMPWLVKFLTSYAPWTLRSVGVTEDTERDLRVAMTLQPLRAISPLFLK